MSIAHEISQLSTCDRKNVGAAILKHDRIVSMGFNGSISGTPHCDEEGHIIFEGHCQRTLHAEQNAILHADRRDLKESTIYVTCFPCIDCFTSIAQVGIDRVIYDEPYDHELNEETRRLADESEVNIDHMDSICGRFSQGGDHES